MLYSPNMREEELKNKVAEDWFSMFDTTQIVGDVDFSVALKHDKQSLWNESEFLLWAEAKRGTHHDIYESFVQLILTIGKARTYDQYIPPTFLGAFDSEKIAFIQYNSVMYLFSLNDFNWNVTPSNHETKEFKHVMELVKHILDKDTLLYKYNEHGKELRAFIKANFRLNKETLTAISVNKNNFTHVYHKWLCEVKHTIAIDWEVARKENLIDGDFYLADLLSENNMSIKDKLFVLLCNNLYKYNITRKSSGALQYETIDFNDGQEAHKHFWKRYTRPPKQEYWDYICNRRDLLVPQDVRERKGSFFTPARWVELSQEYIARELGEDWQDEYFVWDCCAGTGNLLAGLTNKYNLYASTLDSQDVKVMQDMIASNSINLLDSHVFQFDFLNDSFEKLPQSLREIINDEEKRKKLVIYINPPYAEAASTHTITGKGQNKKDVAVQNLTYKKYLPKIGIAGRELFAQFFIRVFYQLHGVILAEFSTLKILQAPNFREFRSVFNAQLGRMFIVPAFTFDNVKGRFPIGFFIWDTAKKEVFVQTKADVYDEHSKYIGQKTIALMETSKSINDWIISTRNRTNETEIGYMSAKGNDFQNANYNFIINNKEQLPHPRGTSITDKNIKEIVIYLAVRQCIEATWLNDRDQFFFPKDTWEDDLEFQSDCLAYTLFHRQNRISAVNGLNHWIPFTEEEVGAKERFHSHFMANFICGKRKTMPKADLFTAPDSSSTLTAIVFSTEAQAVMDAGRELWRYYHSHSQIINDASYYDIRFFFQGKNDKGKMNSTSDNKRYCELLGALRETRERLAAKLQEKVYEHGFLMQ